MDTRKTLSLSPICEGVGNSCHSHGEEISPHLFIFIHPNLVRSRRTAQQRSQVQKLKKRTIDSFRLTLS